MAEVELEGRAWGAGYYIWCMPSREIWGRGRHMDKERPRDNGPFEVLVGNTCVWWVPGRQGGLQNEWSCVRLLGPKKLKIGRREVPRSRGLSWLLPELGRRGAG